MLIDTDVLIWYMRGNDNARKAIEKYSPFSISVVTYMELVQGMRNKSELVALRQFLKSRRVDIVYLSEEISAKAMFYVEQFYLSHSMELADAMIGATAVANGDSLLTGNVKHYRSIKELQIKTFKPD
ncbi:MAG: type II toxin-antitoxin system VapC family toxin [Gammaproteobacteria bacterium]|nr:MAG: type II toxin-antitoxin system VapC family toxin [Gammaproteobacteria bacterium]